MRAHGLAPPSRVTGPDEAHHEVVGRAARRGRAAGRPARPCPRSCTTTCSATSIASSWSWVTNTVVTWTSSCRRRSQTRSSSRTRASSAPNGSSSSSTRGSTAQRAGERHALALPARELRRVAVGQPLEVHELEQLVHACLDLGLGALAHLQPEGDVVADGHVLEGGVVLEDEADAAPLRAGSGWRPAPSITTVPSSGCSSPAITRSRVDLPLPLGPSSAVSEPCGDVQRHVVQRREVVVALRYVA